MQIRMDKVKAEKRKVSNFICVLFCTLFEIPLTISKAKSFNSSGLRKIGIFRSQLAVCTDYAQE